MWRCNKNGEAEDIGMAAAGVIFPSSKILREREKKEAFLGKANIE
jgi:hypothetical protein